MRHSRIVILLTHINFENIMIHSLFKINLPYMYIHAKLFSFTWRVIPKFPFVTPICKILWNFAFVSVNCRAVIYRCQCNLAVGKYISYRNSFAGPSMTVILTIKLICPTGPYFRFWRWNHASISTLKRNLFPLVSRPYAFSCGATGQGCCIDQ